MFRKILLLVCLTTAINFSLSAQSIKNVQQKIKNGRIVITYDLEGSDHYKYKVSLVAKNDTGNKIIPQVTVGDNGNITPGGNYTIYWEPVLEGKRLEDWQISLKLDVSIPGMTFVEGGTFQMGSNNSDADYDEKPVHSVIVDDFYISKYEVTQAEWEKVMGNNPSKFKGDNRPVGNISWYDAVEFCNKKSEMEGLEKCYLDYYDNIFCDFFYFGFRLPTEAEWEFAARGGVESDNANYRYSGSNDIDKVAWYNSNSGSKTHPVGQKKSNELGIYDMSGNVCEWCNDWYDSYYYETEKIKLLFFTFDFTQNNPWGPAHGSSRVIRGGSCDFNDFGCRIANRRYEKPGSSNGDVGFRFVISVEELSWYEVVDFF